MREGTETLKLDSVTITDFRAIENTSIPLDPEVTVLIGDNAAGKTAVLDAIALALLPLVRDFTSPARRDIIVRASDFRSRPERRSDGLPDRAEKFSVRLSSSIGPIDTVYRLDEQYADRPRAFGDHERRPVQWLNEVVKSGRPAPILAYYRDNRGQLQRDANFKRRIQQGRRAAYFSAFSPRVFFDEALDWFEEMEAAELRDQREFGTAHHDQRLRAVRMAVESLIPQVSDLRMLGQPPELAMTLNAPGLGPNLLTVSQLSSGFRVMVALAMDLARRMADLNPEEEVPTSSHGVVLIDEIDLHLHPKWQQLVVSGLRTAFPNVQFIITTHSPQVLTTLREQNIVMLSWRDGALAWERPPSTDGAESGRLLLSAMGVQERPPAVVSPFVKLLKAYEHELNRGQGGNPEAEQILARLRQLSPDDPVLATLDLEKRRLAARQPPR